MTSQARKIWDINKHGNVTLEPSNLEKIAAQKDQNWEKGETAYIFADGSAIVDCGDNDYRIEASYGLHRDNEQLK
jgi:hypothetical protein